MIGSQYLRKTTTTNHQVFWILRNYAFENKFYVLHKVVVGSTHYLGRMKAEGAINSGS